MMMMIMMTPISIYEVRSLKRKAKKKKKKKHKQVAQADLTAARRDPFGATRTEIFRLISFCFFSYLFGSYKGVIFEIFSMQALCAVCIMCCQCLLSPYLSIFLSDSSGQIITPHSAISSERHDLPRSLGLDFK